MSAVCLRLTSMLCLFGTTLSQPGSGGVVWRTAGGLVTIQCRHPAYQQNLSLKRGMSQDSNGQPVLYKGRSLTIGPQFTGRVQLRGVLPNVDVVISNLTSADTGAYWCMYETFNATTNELKKPTGNGSVLLVVTEEQECERAYRNLMLVTVMVSAVVLLGIVMVAIWIMLRTKTRRHTISKPRRITTNDVYEDMRGTVRR